jgi:succinate dehydrogenase hydrophobic anchor subunit
MPQLALQSDPQDPHIISYMTLRKAIGWMGFLLPPLLVLGSFILDHTNEVKSSLSYYYWTHMRNILVGVLCIMGGFLLSYHGPDGIRSWDSLASKSAGLFAFCIAFIPTSQNGDNPLSDLIHYIVAALFLAILSFMSIFLFTKSGEYVTTQKLKRNKVFKVCGIIMLISICLIPISGIKIVYDHIHKFKPTLICETVALISFGISWLVKGELIFKDKSDTQMIKRDKLTVTTVPLDNSVTAGK